MKKVLELLIALILLLTGCISDEEYINTTKTITLADGQTVEQYVNNLIKVGEMCQTNETLKIFEEEMAVALEALTKEEGEYFLRKSRLLVPEDIAPITWEIEGETKAGKVVIASNENIRVKIETEKDKDYIRIDGEKVFTYDKETNRLIPQEELNIAMAMYDLAERCDYHNPKRFNEREVLKNKEGNYKLEYYPSGRVKYLSDDVIVYLELEDRSYIKDIAKSLKKLDEEIYKYDDESINALVDYSYELEYQIIAEKLNKKITKEEKEEIKKLEKEATRIFDGLQLKVEAISGY